MATATSFSDFSGTGSGIVGDGRGLRRAMRHSRTVRILRKVLPAGVAGLLVVYGLSMMSSAGIDTGLPKLDIGRVVSTDLKMSNPSYQGYGKDGASYRFAAKFAQQDLTNPTYVKLEGITGKLIQGDKTETDVTATRGTFDNKASLLELFDGIDVVSQSGMKVKLPTASIQTKESLLTSKDPVVVEFPAGNIKAVGLTLRQKAREVTFGSDVVAHLVPAKANAKAVPAEPAPAAGMFGQANAPLDITSHRLDVQDGSKKAIFTGSVRAVQGESVMETPELTVGYGADTAAQGQPGAQPAEAAAGPMGAAAGKVKDIFAKGPVVMTRGTTDRVTSDQAKFDAQAETGVLLGNVVMTSGVDRKATGDRVDLNQKTETVVLTGSNVVVTQGKNELRGQRLVVNRKAATTQLTSPQSGRIGAVLYQSEKKGGAANPKPEPAPNGGGSGGFAAFKSDPSAPIKLAANQLDVNDTTKLAVFSGDVVAEQGDFVMNTSEMHVSYTGAAGLAEVAATSPTAQKGPAAQVSKIQAKRKVVMTSKDGRTVNGDWADFDMKANKVIVGGNVVLTEGKSQVQGTRLVIDLKTGQSTMDVDATKVLASPDGGSRANDSGEGVRTNGGRPSAVFYPSQFKDKMKKKPEPQPQQ